MVTQGGVGCSHRTKQIELSVETHQSWLKVKSHLVRVDEEQDEENELRQQDDQQNDEELSKTTVVSVANFSSEA